MISPVAFTPELTAKIEFLTKRARRKAIQMGRLTFSSPLILAPMAGICHAPFRQLMQDLGSGGAISEFISSNGISYANKRTVDLMRIFPTEENVGIQIYGEHASNMKQAAELVEKHGANFVDINMGCPVRKIVTRGSGSALLKDPNQLYKYITTIKENLAVPLTIKIRTGWDETSRNSAEVIQVAKEAGVEFVSIHGRTKTQAYTGKADWDYLESLCENSPLPLIGNGDLHHTQIIREKLKHSKFNCFMIARGCLRSPFIFLESFLTEEEEKELSKIGYFTSVDMWEVLQRYNYYLNEHFTNERITLMQFKKMAVWLAMGFPYAAHFRTQIFPSKDFEAAYKITKEFFEAQQNSHKHVDFTQEFLNGGHG